MPAKLYHAVDQREERVIAADSHVRAGIEVGAALPDQDVTGDDALAAETLDPKPLSIGVATVSRRTGALFRGKKLQVEVKHSRAIVTERPGNATPPRGGGSRAAGHARLHVADEVAHDQACDEPEKPWHSFLALPRTNAP